MHKPALLVYRRVIVDLLIFAGSVQTKHSIKFFTASCYTLCERFDCLVTISSFWAIDLLSHLLRDSKTKWNEECNFIVSWLMRLWPYWSEHQLPIAFMLQKRKWMFINNPENEIIRFLKHTQMETNEDI